MPILFWIILITSSSTVFADEQSWLFDSPRSLGRGRTFVAAHDSDEASFLNPASLSEADVSFQIRPTQADFMVGSNTLSTISDITTLLNSNIDLLSLLNIFDKKFGQRQYLKGQASFLNFRIGSFELTPFTSNSSWLEINTPTSPQAEWNVDSVAGSSMSIGLPISKELSFGLTLRYFYRWYIEGNVAFVDLLEFINPDNFSITTLSPLVGGTYLSGDLGLIWKNSSGLRLGMTIRNIGDASAVNTFKNTPPAYKQNISTGLLYRMKLASLLNLDYYLDIHSMTNRQGLSLLRLINTGFELGSSILSRDHDYGLLLGVNEGYISMGSFMDLYFIRLDLVNYGVELGHSPGQKLERRWALSARTSLTF